MARSKSSRLAPTDAASKATDNKNNGDAPSSSSHSKPRSSTTSINALDPRKAADRRLKARERQRRKRERDRLNSGRGPNIGSATFRAAPVPILPDDESLAPVAVAAPEPPPPPPPPPPPQPSTPPAPPPTVQAQTNNAASSSSASASTSASTSSMTTPLRSARRVYDDANMTPEEVARRDKVRESARLRQQKHRYIVKQRKLAELGLSLNSDGLGGLEEMHYALGPDGSYQQILPPPPQPNMLSDHHQPTFTAGHTGGATFASTLLLSFSCAPLLKQHLLRTLHMTTEELASLEPVLAAAWDQWDHARRMHYAEQAAKANQQQQHQTGGASSSSSTAPQPGTPNGHPNHNLAPVPPFILPHPPPGLDATSLGNDYRARFHRPLTAPSLFGSGGHVVVNGMVSAADGSANGSASVSHAAQGMNAGSSNGETPLDSEDGREDGDGEADGDGDADVDMTADKDDEDVDANI